MKKLFYILTILALLVLPALASWNVASARALGQSPQTPSATILYVKPGGSGFCTSWAEACELQAALLEADPGEEIWVQAGVYTPTSGADRTATFHLESGVAIYGGFAGTETERAQRDWETNVTILSGDIGVADDNSDNSYHVVTGSGVNVTAVLDGFIIIDGNANGGSNADYGGGMYNNAGSPRLANLIFFDNSAVYAGGGMVNLAGSNPTLTDVAFSDNSANRGGGMYSATSSNSELENVTFSSNSADIGGGMYNTGSNPELENVTFSSNTAIYGGGVYNTSSNPTLTDAVFSGNNASQDGGGMYNAISGPELTDVAFTRNTAVDFGGGMYNNTSSPTLTNVTFSGNTTGQNGGGIYNRESSPTFTNLAFSGNLAIVSGGGMYNYSSSPTLTNITFSGNTTGPNGGGGISNYMSSNPTITNAILWGNTPVQIDNRGGTAPVISYSDIYGGCPTGATCSQVINDNPQFIRNPSPGADGTWGTPDDDYGDLHVHLTSPVIDAGNNDAVPAGVLTDLDGSPRFFDVLIVADTGNGIAPIVDMGAYEALTETIPPTVVSILRADPSLTNAASVNFTVTFSEAVTGVGTGDFALTPSGVTGASVTGVSGGPTVYTVTISTGSGDGTLRLDVPDTATVIDLAGNPLSGLPYEAGESYTIDKTAPTVVSILRADPNPTNAASVNFTVTFSEAVAGVDADDFDLTPSGITGAAITGVSGGPTVYTVAISTGSGDGILWLDVPVTATITDLVGNPLSGLPYEDGETYTVDKTAPTVVSILRADPNPTNAASVNFTVTFSEDVIGVDVGDFSLFTTGSISGSSVTNVSGTGATYTVTVSIGTGSGTLRLDVPETATITDLVGNPLSGLPYETGEAYTILWLIYLPLVMNSTP
jgi:predicted outer membrane repeat protein